MTILNVFFLGWSCWSLVLHIAIYDHIDCATVDLFRSREIAFFSFGTTKIHSPIWVRMMYLCAHALFG